MLCHVSLYFTYLTPRTDLSSVFPEGSLGNLPSRCTLPYVQLLFVPSSLALFEVTITFYAIARLFVPIFTFP